MRLAEIAKGGEEPARINARPDHAKRKEKFSDMRQQTRALWCLALCAFLLFGAMPMAAGAAEPADAAEGETLFSLADLRDAQELAALIQPQGSSVIAFSYDEESGLYLADTTAATSSLNTAFFDISNWIDTTREHWLRGLTLEYEVVLADIGDANPLFQLGVYAYGAGENLSQSVNADTGPSVWWYPTQGVCATNGYPTKDQFNSKKLPSTGKENGTALRFRVLENEEGLFQYCWNGTDAEWVLLAAHPTEELLNCACNPWLRLRRGDVYGLRSLTVSKTPADESPAFPEMLFRSEELRGNPGLLETLVEEGGGTTASYNAQTDTLELNVDAATGGLNRFSGLVHLGPYTNADRAHWLRGLTVEFEVVLETLTSSNPTFGVSVYEEAADGSKQTSVFRGTGLWWYPYNRGLVSASSVNVDNAGASDCVTVPRRGEEGDSCRIRITEDENGLFFYCFDETAQSWRLIESYNAAELPYTRGILRVTGRNGDVYGIRNLVVYRNPIAIRGVQETSAEAGEYSVRFLAEVRDLACSEVGFELSAAAGGETLASKSYRIQTVYRTLLASEDGELKEIAAQGGSWFAALVLTGIPAAEGEVTFVIRPWAVRDGVRTEGPAYTVVYNAGSFEALRAEGNLKVGAN